MSQNLGESKPVERNPAPIREKKSEYKSKVGAYKENN
jgi:hypothetical protein